jgi:hypothetical protein
MTGFSIGPLLGPDRPPSIWRRVRCWICEILIRLALKVSPRDYLPSVVEAAERLGRLAYENEYRKDNGLPAARLQ